MILPHLSRELIIIAVVVMLTSVKIEQKYAERAV